MMAMMGSRRRSSNPCVFLRGQNLFCCGRRRFRVAYPEQPLQDLADHHEAAAKIRLERADFQVVGLIMRDGANEFVRDPRLAEAGIAVMNTTWPSPSHASCQALFSICNCISRPMKGDSCVSARNCQRERPRLISVTS